MRAWRFIRTVLIGYALLCTILAVFLGELAFRALRTPSRDNCACLRRNRFRCRLVHFTSFFDHSSKVGGASVCLRLSHPSQPVVCM